MDNQLPRLGYRGRSAMSMKFDLRSIAPVVPLQARWWINGTPLDFEFATSSGPPRWRPDEMPDQSEAFPESFTVFAKQDYAEGGGACCWICVDEQSGAVFGYDPERDDPVFVLNSSIERFAATFLLLDTFLANGKPICADCRERLDQIDPDAFLRSDWRMLVDCLQYAEPDDARESPS